MQIYGHILFATDLGPQSVYIGQQAVKLATLCGAKVTSFHAIEPPMSYTAHFAQREEELKKLKEADEKNILALNHQLNLSATDYLIMLGTPQTEIVAAALAQHCDLIVLGSHGIGGYTHQLGSTAESILLESPCDILVIQTHHLKAEIEQAKRISGQYLWQGHTTFLPRNHEKLPTYGSKQGFGDVVRRGPHPTKQPQNTPYKGGTRTRASDEENSSEE